MARYLNAIGVQERQFSERMWQYSGKSQTGHAPHIHLHQIVTRQIILRDIIQLEKYMSKLKDAAVDGVILGATVPLLGKGHEIITATRKTHGTVFKWDGKIVRDSLGRSPRMTITTGVIAALAFTTGSWVSRVLAADHTAQGVSTNR